MTLQSIISAIALLTLAPAMVAAQSDETALSPPQAKITTVSSMRVRKAPQATAEEVQRLKLGTVVNALARSTNQDTIGSKTDYWYRVNLPNGQTGWLFGGLLLDYSAQQRVALLRQIIEARLEAENTDFADRGEIYNLAASYLSETKDTGTRAEFELLKLLALRSWAVAFPDDKGDKSPHREWVKTHAAEVVRDEFAGGYSLRSDTLWNLESRYHTLPIADRIAWEAAETLPPSDCEGDEVCHLFVFADRVKYLNLHPNGAHVSEALKDLDELITDEVIKSANEKGGDKYAVEQRADLKKLLTSLRAALAKTSAPEKNELIKKLDRISTR